MIRRFLPLLGIGGLSLTLLPAQAQLSSASTVFNGTAPNICQVGTPIQASTPMTVTPGGNGLSGETAPFSFVSNTAVDLQLQSVNANQAPAANNATYQAALLDGNGKAELLSADDKKASGLKKYQQPLTTNDTFNLRLAIAAPQGALLTAGNYVSTVTVDCLSPI